MIISALEHGQKIRQEQLHLGELGVATLSALFTNANRDPKKGKPASPSDFFYFAPKQTQVDIPSTAADAFFSLVADEVMPSWALGIAPIDKLRQVKQNRPVSRPRAWVGEGALLLLPRVEGQVVQAAIALLDGVSGSVLVMDIDSGTTFSIEVLSSDSRWVLDAEFELGGL